MSRSSQTRPGGAIILGRGGLVTSLNHDMLIAIASVYTQNRSRQQLVGSLCSKSSRLHKVTCIQMMLNKLVECVTKCCVIQFWASCSYKQIPASRNSYMRGLLHIHHVPVLLASLEPVRLTKAGPALVPWCVEYSTQTHSFFRQKQLALHLCSYKSLNYSF